VQPTVLVRSSVVCSRQDRGSVTYQHSELPVPLRRTKGAISPKYHPLQVVTWQRSIWKSVSSLHHTSNTIWTPCVIASPRTRGTGWCPNGCLKSEAKYLRGARFLVYVDVELKSTAGDWPLHRSRCNKNNNADKCQPQQSPCAVADQLMISGTLAPGVRVHVTCIMQSIVRVVFGWIPCLTSDMFAWGTRVAQSV
jgi:hypothetical protein